MITILGWFGNIAIVIGLWQIGNKKRWAFIFSMIGEALWIIKSALTGQLDLTCICCIFFGFALVNWIKWRKT